MRIKRKLSLILCFVLTFFFTASYSATAAEESYTEVKPKLNLTAFDSDNFVRLKWSSPDKDKYYYYRLFSKESNEAKFQSIPSKSVVKVLNVYPDAGNNLKSWMEKPNEECDKGYGKGLISVDEVNIKDFNNNPALYMKNSNNTWKYDVIMIGSWDCNNNLNPTDDAVNLISDFLDSGRGVLAGHDTIGYSWGINKGLGKIRDRFNVKIGYWGNSQTDTDKEFSYYGGYIGDKVTIKKKGLLTNYPWNIEDTKSAKELDRDNNVILSVPISHSTSNFAFGDIWMTYSDNVKYSNSNFPDNLNVNANYYLTTYNNTAMIQTGHSNGTATPDEQKVLANTLFYLAQVTEDTNWDDHKGQDLKAPTKPELKSVIKNSNRNKITISYDESQDIGSNYDYYVEAKEKNTSNIVKSDIKTINITSGLKGYSIVIDQNENTIPDAVVETTSTEYEVDNTFGNDFYIHVAAVDNAGNVSEVSTYKYSRPVLELTPSTTEEVKDKVTIRAKTLSTKKIEKIITPDGKKVDSDSTEYDVDVNGTYTFTAVDVDGNETTESITINNIKPDVVLNVEPNMNRTHLKENFVADLTINHIKSIYATEVRIKYDSSRLEFLGLDTIDGIELVNNDKSEGEITLLLASLGFENVLEDETLIKLNFTGIAAGDALIEVAKADVADGDFMEKTLRDAECGETTISIVDRELTSVDNKDKAFTLLDLSIIAKHYGEDPNALLLKGIDADLNLDGKIDKADYNKCYKLMLKNPNRKF